MENAIVMAGADRRIIHWNDTATAWFGYTAAEAMGHLVDLLVPDDAVDRHREGFTRTMDGGERHLVGATVNLPVRLRNGETLAFPARFVHIEDPAGKLIAAMAVFSLRQGDEAPWTPIALH